MDPRDEAAIRGLEEGTAAFQRALDRIAHDLMPIYIATEMLAMGTTDGQGDAAPVKVKLFMPDGGMTWFITEYDRGDDMAFGWVHNASDPHASELGYISLAELRQLRGPMRLRIERDLHFQPTTLGEVQRDKTHV